MSEIQTSFKQLLAIDAEARRLERDRIMGLFAAIKSDILRHVPSGSDSTSVEDTFREFEEAVDVKPVSDCGFIGQ